MDTNPYESPKSTEQRIPLKDLPTVSLGRLLLLIAGSVSGTLGGASIGSAVFLRGILSVGALLAYIAAMMLGAFIGIMVVRVAYRSWSKRATNDSYQPATKG